MRDNERRLSTIQKADIVYVLSGGEVVESGNHDSLLAARGEYYRLYSASLLEEEKPESVAG